MAGAVVVTFFTFLPSFFFIFIGAPFIESTHGDLRFTAPLTAITAAVVGVIVNLAVFFAVHVLWPHGAAVEKVDWPAAVIGVLALFALVRLRVGVISVIAGVGRPRDGGAAGLKRRRAVRGRAIAYPACRQFLRPRPGLTDRHGTRRVGRLVGDR